MSLISYKKFTFLYRTHVKIIDSFSNRALSEYKLILNPFTLSNLKRLEKKVSSVEASLLLKIFNAEETLSLEDIILKRIVFNIRLEAYDNPTLHWYWDYATPVEILKHLKKFQSGSPEATELIFLLEDMIHVLYPQKSDDGEFIKYLFNDNLQMPAVIDSIEALPEYNQILEKHINAQTLESVKMIFN